MGNRISKIVLFISLIIVFIVLYLYSIFGGNVSFYSIDDITKNRKEKKDLITEMKINGIDTIYDSEDNVFYYSLPNTVEDSKLVLKLDLPKNYKFKLIKERTSFIKVDFDSDYQLIIYNNKSYMKTNIRLTNLPIININTTGNIGSSNVNATFKYINNSVLERVVDANIKVRVRGTTSRLYDKKSLKVSVYNDDYSDNKKINLSNFEELDSFIFDANYRDPSNIRNTLAFDIWNDMSSSFTNIEINHEFVEVFINGKYNGLYVLFEPIKRQTLNLDKSTSDDTSVIIKQDGWNHDIVNNNISNVKKSRYLEYELKYPNDEELFDEAWKKALSILSDYHNKNIKNTDEVLENTFYIENYIDLALFNSFINNGDNKLQKNNYLYLNSLDDTKIGIEPWDMEFSFGAYWCEKCFNNIIIKDDYNNILLELDQENAPNTTKKIIKRYKELRKTIFTEKYLNNLIDNYKNELKYASQRDSNKWYEYEIDEEIERVREWLIRRIEVYDKYIEGIEDEI